MKLNKGYNSRIAYQGQSWYLGVYLTPEEAARVYDEARIVLVSQQTLCTVQFHHADKCMTLENCICL